MIFKKEIKLEEIEGSIEIEIYKYKERLKLVKEMNITLDGNSEVKFASGQIDTLEKMNDLAVSRIKKVDLIIVESGKKIESIDELEYYSVCQLIMNEVIDIVFNGAALGKPKGRALKIK